MQIIWRNVVGMTLFHVWALYSFIFTSGQELQKTALWGLLFILTPMLGIQVGAHRLWTHRSFKAKWPLRLFLMLWQTMALQKDIYDWCRDHRLVLNTFENQYS